VGVAEPVGVAVPDGVGVADPSGVGDEVAPEGVVAEPQATAAVTESEATRARRRFWRMAGRSLRAIRSQRQIAERHRDLAS